MASAPLPCRGVVGSPDRPLIRPLLTAAVLLAAGGKDGETAQLQLRGDGDLGPVTAIGDDRARVRGYVHNPEAHPPSRAGKLDDRRQHDLVAAMYAIEIADGHHRIAMNALKPLVAAYNVHRPIHSNRWRPFGHCRHPAAGQVSTGGLGGTGPARTPQGRRIGPVQPARVAFACLPRITTRAPGAGVIVSMVPCILLFVLLQRYYVAGLMGGAVKG